MTEYKFVNFRQPTSEFIPRGNGDVTSRSIDFSSSVPELAEQMDGWEAVSFQVTPVGGDVVLTLLLRAQVDAEELLPPKL